MRSIQGKAGGETLVALLLQDPAGGPGVKWESIWCLYSLIAEDCVFEPPPHHQALSGRLHKYSEGVEHTRARGGVYSALTPSAAAEQNWRMQL